MQNIHDSGYKRLFSHKGFIKQLLMSFIPFEWVKQINYEKIEKLNVSFVRKNYKNKESDVIYKLPYKDKEIYIYILIEFQSAVDKWMSLRMLSYIIDFYEDLIKQEKPDKLPAIFPIMLYNGEEKWTAKEEISKLIKNIENADEIRKYVPKFEYYKIIINEFEEEKLERINNAVSGIFLIENAKDDIEIEKRIGQTVNILKQEIDKDIIDGFINWIRRILEEEGVSEEIDKKLESLKEGKTMLTNVIENMRIKYRKEGMQQGMQQGVFATAKNMFKKGFEEKVIEEVTGLSKEELKKIKKTMH
ncbi:MAG: Rpn family recombination-promoting nuclease/putative transposase [Candidatus Firestonebacteria bacterium]|nr:Rpn family recombination-promoting nuclease/putative transposase [Candidatus Firestonebacteria bacterium]